MEIDKNLPNKSNNYSFKNEDINEVPPNVTLLDQKSKVHLIVKVTKMFCKIQKN